VSVFLCQLYGMQMASFLRCFIFSSLTCLVSPYFSTLTHKRQDFRNKKVIEHKMFGFLYSFCLIHFSFWEEFSEILSYIYTGLHARYPLLSDFNQTWIFSTDFRKNPQISKSMKIRPVAAESFHADIRTDMAKLTAAFRNFANEPKKFYILPTSYRFVLYGYKKDTAIIFLHSMNRLVFITDIVYCALWTESLNTVIRFHSGL
jgi:hypothetical protein